MAMAIDTETDAEMRRQLNQAELDGDAMMAEIVQLRAALHRALEFGSVIACSIGGDVLAEYIRATSDARKMLIGNEHLTTKEG